MAMSAIAEGYPSLGVVQTMPAWKAMRREAASALALAAKQSLLEE